jgi:hypothetical protein
MNHRIADNRPTRKWFAEAGSGVAWQRERRGEAALKDMAGYGDRMGQASSLVEW